MGTTSKLTVGFLALLYHTTKYIMSIQPCSSVLVFFISHRNIGILRPTKAIVQLTINKPWLSLLYCYHAPQKFDQAPSKDFVEETKTSNYFGYSSCRNYNIYGPVPATFFHSIIHLELPYRTRYFGDPFLDPSMGRGSTPRTYRVLITIV